MSILISITTTATTRRAATLLLLLTLGACSDSAPPHHALPPDARAPDLQQADSFAIEDSGRLDQGAAADSVLDAGPVDGGWPTGFTPQPQSLPSGYLCTIPADYVSKGGDPVNPPCVVEADRFSDRDHSVTPSSLKVVTWNVEYGKKSAEIQQALTSDADLKDADVLLLQEVPRLDKSSTPQGINLARQLAQALKMDYVFMVEWDRRLDATQVGEHGVAILSKYPLGNVVQIRHTALHNFYGEKKHFGGRATLGADLALGSKRLRIYSAHLCTRDYTGTGRAKQATEIVSDTNQPGRPAAQIIGGDFNTFLCNPKLVNCNKAPTAEKVIQNLNKLGWINLTPGFNGWTQAGLGFFLQRLDWLFGKAVTPTTHKVMQSIKAADHVPVVATVTVP